MNTTVIGWRRWLPTDKWVASLATGAAAVVSSWIATGAFDQEERAQLAVPVPSLVAAYFVSNKDRLSLPVKSKE